jgi:hypothetical protein
MKDNTIMNAAESLLPKIFYGIVLGFTVSNPAIASQLPGGWWDGNWNCNIDGRPARMRWNVVDDRQTTCNGDTCSTSYGVKWKGNFSDNGSRWVALTEPRRGDKGGLYFRHADGNQWYLAKPTNNRTAGWTTWNGKRYPLSCWR